jgi:hypothetical protein
MANKKINQLVAKTTIQSTDLFPLGDASTGQLFKKTIAELQAAIGGAVISVNGLVGTVVLDTDDIQELATPTNKYFTDARARGAISLTVTGNSGASTYSNSTGVLNVPTYTLAGLGGITATFLSGASGIAYNSTTGVITYTGTVFTDASIRALVSAGAGLSYNSSTGVFSYSGTVYTDASIRALISLTTTGNSGVSSYNNTTGVLNVPNYTLAGLGGISLTSLSGTAPITYNSSTGAIGITQANTSTNGFLSSTDWNTFNGKQSALTLGNVTEVASNVLMFPDGGTNKTIGNLSIQVVQSGASTNGYLSSTDWTTFNNKQATVTLTTTGTSGAATFSAGTLNIPQYQAVLTNPVTGTGTTNFVTKWTSSSAIGNSSIFDDGTNLGIGMTPGAWASGFVALQLASSTAIWSGTGTGGGSYFTSNVLFDGARKYINSSFASEYQQSGGNHYFQVAGSGTAGNAISFNTAMTITNAGNVGIGTSSPSVNANQTSLTINGTNVSRLDMQVSGTRNAGFVVASDAAYLETTAAIPLVFYTNSLERMRITSGGNVAIGTTVDIDHKLKVAGIVNSANGASNSVGGGAAFLLDGSATNGSSLTFLQQGVSKFAIWTYTGSDWGERMIITSGGNILMGTSSDNGERLYVSGSIRATGSITANSDVRLKKNIERIENALQKVSEISGYTYNTIYDEDRHAGVIAQEIDKVLPEIVNKGNDGLMGVEYGNISALLIEAIKDLKVQNDSLQARLSALEK